MGTSLAAEPLLALAVTVTSEQRVDSVLECIVQGLASQPGVALARIWLLPSADLPSFCHAVSDPADCLCLVASAGTPINSPGEDWRFLQGHFARVSFNVGKVGQVAASRHPILIEDATQNDWVVRPEWAKREEIRSFAGHPLIFRDKLLGVIAVFSRQPFGQREFTWLGLFANQAAVAIANARAEESLQSSERNLAAIINTIPTTAWTTRPDGYCDFLNRVWLDYAGMTAEEAQGWGWAEAIHPEDRKKLVEEWQSCLASGAPVDTETRIRRFDGSYRWFLIRANPLRDESGNILKWYGTCLDIEDHKRGEEALRTRELSWRQIVDNIPGLVATTGTMGEVEFLNRQTLEYFGRTSEELRNWALIGAVHPDDLPRVIEARKKSIETGQIYEVEHRCRRADGVYRWFQVRGLPVRDTENKVTAWYLLLTDIDDRKQAEAQVEQAYLRLAEAQRLSKTGSFITDLLADEHNWSEEAFRIFEFDPSTKVGVQMIRDRVHPEDLPTFDAVITRGMTGTDVDFVFRIVTRGDAVKHIRGLARVMAQSEGRPLFIGAFQDVTASKMAEQALNKARSELAEVARITTLNALTASIAHEVNQPLSGIITNASTCLRMLSADPPNVDGARETARRTIRDGNRASDVIKRLRALFSKKELTLEPLDLNEAARAVITVFWDQLQRKRVLLLTEFDPGLPAVTGDRVQLQQVILNLLRNASDAMSTIDDRPRELVVKTTREEDDRVCLSVKDAGIGLDPQAADRLFQPFYTTKRDGMGIGLSISRSIIEAHQGRLWAAPNAGAGATFSFSIPGGQAHPTKSAFAIGFLSNGDELVWVPQVLKILQDEFPDLNVTTSTQFSPFLAEALSKGQIDAALIRREEGWPDLVYETVVIHPLIVYLPKSHRLAAFQEISPQDLVGETFIMPAKTSPVLRRVIDDYLKQSGVNITANQEVDSPTGMVSSISSGGVGIYPTYGQNFLPDSVTARPLKGNAPTIDLVLGYKKSNQSPVLKFLLSRLSELIARCTKAEA